MNELREQVCGNKSGRTGDILAGKLDGQLWFERRDHGAGAGIDEGLDLPT